jgi:uncharacterized membrane-anchored protein YitT (DUF2179 family)
MAYFNHAFTKMFLGTGTTRTAPSTGAPISVTNPASTGGFITTTGTTTATLSTLAPGYFGFFDKNYQSINPSLTSYGCCPLILASSSLLANDKIGPFHGGYKETNKSKTINPKYVQRAYKVTTCVPQQTVVSVGNTPQTGSGTASIGTFVAGTAASWVITGSIYTIIVPVTGGTGAGAMLSVTVSALGTATAAVLSQAGTGYTIGDILTAVGGAADTTVTVVTVAVTNSNNFQGGTTDATCCFEFLCGETYYLRIDVKGSPVLRVLNHNAYQTLSAYTGCCSGVVPTAVDSTLVMIEWAKALVINNYLNGFVAPVVFDELGVAWYAPGTTVSLDGLSTPVLSTQWWDAYISPGHGVGLCAGLRLFGAFVETKFGNCSFQVTDFFEKEPIKVYASMVDYTGDPCVFEGICVYTDCLGLQGMGFGEQVVRDLIKAESYLQNFFHSDIRIREITQGFDILNSVNRNALYTRYFLLHSVPRFNNPTGVFDNDRYLLEIVVPEANPLVPVGNTALDSFLGYWLDSCVDCVTLETEGCTYCTVVPD